MAHSNSHSTRGHSPRQSFSVDGPSWNQGVPTAADDILSGVWKFDDSRPNRYNVLIIEDDDDELSFLQQLLTNSGYHTLTTHSGDNALRMLESTSIDLLICDTSMRVAECKNFLRTLRKMPDFSATPVIVLSDKDAGTDMDLLVNGADLVCVKETAKRSLLPQIELLLD